MRETAARRGSNKRGVDVRYHRANWRYIGSRICVVRRHYDHEVIPFMKCIGCTRSSFIEPRCTEQKGDRKMTLNGMDSRVGGEDIRRGGVDRMRCAARERSSAVGDIR